MGTVASSVLYRSAMWDVGIQMSAGALSLAFHTERFFDSTGIGTFAFLAIQSYRWGKVKNQRQTVQTALVTAWAVRLGLFLLNRISHDGGIDKRFNHVRDNPKVFLFYWAIQALWIFVTLIPTLLLNSEKKEVPLGYRDYLGWALWALGMGLEVVSDHQKSVFRGNADNKNKFITSGLWSISRHPNYLGEITLWAGLFISASSVFSGWQHASVISPLFVYFLLTRISGIPILERRGMKKWGSDPNYLEYVKRVSVLFPSLW